jgi:hypothetical protein
VELLDRLRRSVRDCVTRRSELEKDTALRTTRLRAQHEQALTAEQARWAAETEKTNSTAAASQTAIEAIFAARKTRIAKALNNAQQERLKRIEAEEGKHTFENQSGLFEAERVRDTETLQNKTQHESLHDRTCQRTRRPRPAHRAGPGDVERVWFARATH